MTPTERETLQSGIKALESIGLHTKHWEPAKTKYVDYILELQPDKNEKTQRYLVEVKTTLNNASLSQWLLDLKLNNKPTNNLALLTKYISPTLSQKLREMEISYFDTAGNAYFKNPTFYIYITGRKPKEQKPKSTSLFRPAGIKFLLHLLSEPGLEERDYRELAEVTDIPKSTIGELMADLEKRDFLVYYRTKRRLVNKSELLRRWVEAFTENYRSKLVRGKFHAPVDKADWWESVHIDQFQACWGGEVAAQKLVGHIKPEVITIYADSLLPKVQAQYRLRRDENGNIEVLKRFWKNQPNEVAPPLVAYADLIYSSDSRNLETAQMIYEKYLYRLVEDAPE
jgi:hypothetical protein